MAKRKTEKRGTRVTGTGALGVADESRAAGIAGVAEGLATESGRCGARSEPFAQPAIVSTMSASNATQARVVMRRSSRVNALRQSVRRIVCFRDVDPLRSGSGVPTSTKPRRR